MKALFLAVVFGMACAGKGGDFQASEVNGKWNTLAILADKLEKIQEGGALRGLFRHVEATEDKQSMTVSFYNKQSGECKKYTVVGERKEDGVYVGEYFGTNEFKILKQGKDIIIFYNENVDDEGQITRMILVAGKGQRLSKQQEKKLLTLAKKQNIPSSSLQHVMETDDCPQE